MKVCRKCLHSKENAMFSKDKNSADGLQHNCKECVNKYMAEYYAANSERIRQRVRNHRLENREAHKQMDRDKYKRKRDEILIRCKAYQAAHPEQVRAKRKLHVALHRGELTRPDICEKCGRTDAVIDAHHDDYGNPLDIAWLCRFCHRQLHAEPQQEVL